MSTVLTSAVPSSEGPVGIVGIPRFFLGLSHRSGVNVSVVDTDAPPGRRERPAPQPAATSKAPTRSAIPVARSSIARTRVGAPGPGWGPGAPRDSAVGPRLLGGGAAQGEVAGQRLVLAGAGEAQRLARLQRIDHAH